MAHTTSGQLGILTDDVGSHWGQAVSWQFGTPIVYNEGRGAIFHELELVALPGRAAVGDNPLVWTQYSLDGVNWSEPRSKSAGKSGDRARRLRWLRNGSMKNWRIQRFTGNSAARLAVVRLEAQLEPLAV